MKLEFSQQIFEK